MGKTRGACAWSRLTLACIIEVNACGRDEVQVDWVMEQCDPWAFDGKACALILSNGEFVCMHNCVVDTWVC